MPITNDNQAVSPAVTTALMVAFIIVLAATLYIIAAPRLIPCGFELRITRGTTGIAVSGVAVQVWDGRTLIAEGVTGFDGVARFSGLPCKTIAFSYGGGNWAKSSKEIVDLSAGQPTQLSRPVFACPTPPCG